MSSTSPRQRALYLVIVVGICAIVAVTAGGVSSAQRPTLLASPSVQQVAPETPQQVSAPVPAAEIEPSPEPVPAAAVVAAAAAVPATGLEARFTEPAAPAPSSTLDTARVAAEEPGATTDTAADPVPSSLEDQVAPVARGARQTAAAETDPDPSTHDADDDTVEVDHSISTIPETPDVSASDTTTTVDMVRPDEPDDPWAGVRRCESHNNYSINTGNGFYGAYQFTISSWDWVAGLIGRDDLVGVRPDLATPADQDRLAQALGFEVAGGGLQHWPVCGKYYG